MNEHEEKRLDDIRLLINSTSWVDFLYPEIEKRRQDLTLILLDPVKEKRQNYASDDFIRGAISALTWAARLPKSRLKQMQQPIVQQDDYPELSPADPSEGE